MAASVDGADFTAAMASFASGVTLVTTVDERQVPLGLTATAFASVCKDPPTCFVCVAHEAEAYDTIVRVGRFAVNILAQEHQALSVLFATTGADKFADGTWDFGHALGCPLVPDALASIECEVAHTTVMGDHTAIFGTLRSVTVNTGSPLMYFRGAYATLPSR